MKIQYSTGNLTDLQQLKQLSIRSWSRFKDELTEDNWSKLSESLHSDHTYIELLDTAKCFIAKDIHERIVGMAFIVLQGHPTDIYQADWCYIRFVTVDPDYVGRGIGRRLTELCLEWARNNKENTVALHTSEMMHHARHIYESMGFTVLKEIPSRLGKRYWLYTLNIS